MTNRILALIISLAFCFFSSHIAVAQTVDPCQYGCPKCDKTGKPIEKDE